MTKKHQSQKKKGGNGPVQTELEGTILTNTKGGGVVKREDADGIVRIEPSFIGTALHGDRVRVRLLPRRRKEEDPRGEVVEICMRNKLEYVGILKKEGEVFYLEAQDSRMFRDIVIPEKHLNGAEPGQKVFGRIHIDAWKNPKQNPEGEILKVLGTPGNNDVEMEAIVLDKGFATTFPHEVEEEAQELRARAKESFAEELKNRRDMREVTTFTIDPASAKDFDDALSFRTLENGDVEVGIHIADVSHFVTPGSKIDTEARTRATSIYLVDRTIPMLPEVLSNDLCSLNPEEDKLAFSAVFTFSAQELHKAHPQPTDQWFGKTVIRSDTRFAYEEAQAILNEGSGTHAEELTHLNTLAEKLRDERIETGAITFESEEVKFELDDDGKPISVYTKPVLDTNKLIEEFMLLANRKVAEYVSKLLKEKDAKLFVYRIHEQPDEEKIANLLTFLTGLGYDVSNIDPERISSDDMNKLLEKVSGEAEEHIVHTAAIRAMAKAVYSTKNIGHYGLAFAYYTHFTSPIRRYPDLMVHRLLQTYITGDSMPQKALKTYRDMTDYASEMETIAQEAERSSVKFKQAEYFAERLGEVRTGTISRITDWGMFVQEEETHALGLIRLSDINDDYYVYDEEQFRLVGEDTGKIFRIGDEVKIRIESVDVDQREINYALVNE